MQHRSVKRIVLMRSDQHQVQQRKPRTLLRKANTRMNKAAIEAIAKLLDEYTVEECASHIVNSAYGSTQTIAR